MIEQGIDAGCPILQYQIVDMIRQILPVVVAACVAPCFAAEGWITDMDAAKKQAAEQKKDLMIDRFRLVPSLHAAPRQRIQQA